MTAGDGDRQGGLVATWVSQASLAPERPIICAGLAPNHFTTQLVLSSHGFAVHLLRKDQASVAFPFCLSSGRQVDKIAACREQGIAFKQSVVSAPLLVDCLAVMECQVFAKLHTGDRVYFWADVVTARDSTLDSRGNNPDNRSALDEPLSEHDFFRSATAEQLSTLRRDMESDIRQQLPWHEQWRSALPEICQLPPQ